MKIFNHLLNFVAIGLLGYFAVALGLVFSQWPAPLGSGRTLDFDGVASHGSGDAAALDTYRARDGATLGLRRYPSGGENAPLLVLVHGSGWHGLQFDRLARALAAQADVLVPDLRGHGVSPARRGDVDYIGQLEDDLADLIELERKSGQKVILAGHSSGGGLVVRFAGGAHGDLIDGAVLLAPFLKYNAPTTREYSGGWAHPLTRRIIGLTLLNNFNIKWLNHLTVIQFGFPTAVLEGPLGATATTAYSYRLNTSFAPRSDYLEDIAALPRFLLIAGTKDEAFNATKYEPLMSGASDKGSYRLIPGVSHLGVVDAQETASRIGAFLSEFGG
ncbi:MAG: alpha/beta hydrolase [Paracoccaceae bacterium]